MILSTNTPHEWLSFGETIAVGDDESVGFSAGGDGVLGGLGRVGAHGLIEPILGRVFWFELGGSVEGFAQRN